MINKLSNPSRRHSLAGFTLLELMIVGVLTSVLMLGIWSLFRTWGRMYDRGEQRVQAAQLVRSLCDQFTDDVQSVVHVDPPPRQRTSSSSSRSSRSRRSSSRSSSVGNLALQGGSTWLVLEVLQPPNPYLLTPDTDPGDTLDTQSVQSYAPEWQCVLYTFEPPPSEELDSLSVGVEAMAALDDTELVGQEGEESELEEPFSGLLRLVVAKEQLNQVSRGSRSSHRSSSMQATAWQYRDELVGSADLESEISEIAPATSSATGEEGDGLSLVIAQDEVPEVIWLEFRYFDGSSWSSSWDSQAEGSLPVAIEMRFELKEPEGEESEAIDALGETELVDDGLSETDSIESSLLDAADLGAAGDATLGGVEEAAEETPYHRCLVFLEPRG